MELMRSLIRWRNSTMKKAADLLCFESIEISELTIQGKHIYADVILKNKHGNITVFCIKLAYEERIDDVFLPILRLAFCMPLLNYGLFSEKIILHFPISKIDFKILNEFNHVFCRDIFVNKILRRRADYFLPEYIPNTDQISKKDAYPRAIIEPRSVTNDSALSADFDNKSCGVLSSGGKESLLTYGILNEIGCKTYPFYVNESGGHWRTALPSYRYHDKNDPKTQRVWTNIDRFYLFMLDQLSFIRSNHRKIRSDTYPIRLCIFPFYVFLLLPLFIKNHIGNLLIGSEFDDIRSTPTYRGIKHYFGIYDQHQDFDQVMNNWYEKRMPGFTQWSLVRYISGLIVERILGRRYSMLAHYQRSCHSCHFNQHQIIPCGDCSKCRGVLLFLLANKLDPKIMNFSQKHINSFKQRLLPDTLRLDEDEKNHSLCLMGEKTITGNYIDHVEKIHHHRETCDLTKIPDHLRKDVLIILKKYTNGYCILRNDKWVPTDNPLAD